MVRPLQEAGADRGRPRASVRKPPQGRASRCRGESRNSRAVRCHVRTHADLLQARETRPPDGRSRVAPGARAGDPQGACLMPNGLAVAAAAMLALLVPAAPNAVMKVGDPAPVSALKGLVDIDGRPYDAASSFITPP